MRSSLLLAIAATAILSACASQAPTPVASAAAPAPAPAAAPAAATKVAAVAKAPQCYNGDISQFVDVGTAATIAGVAVTCEKTGDGKNAQWMGKKH